MNPLLNAAHLLVFLAAGSGLGYLRNRSEKWLKVSKGAAWGAVAVQIAWMFQAGFSEGGCVLRGAWGVMTLAGTAGLIGAHALDRRYRFPRLLVGVFVLLSLFFLMGRGVFPPAGRGIVGTMGMGLALHILLVILGYTALAVGCVSGLLYLRRSRGLKREGWSPPAGIPWLALTALDRLFVRSTGWGVLLMSMGVLLGAMGVERLSSGEPWYADPRVALVSAGCLIYAGVLWLRRRIGFCSRLVVGLGTLGFSCILLGFFAAGIFTGGFHLF
jgi:ABC-type uncharacterized transport system permease subunit